MEGPELILVRGNSHIFFPKSSVLKEIKHTF